VFGRTRSSLNERGGFGGGGISKSNVMPSGLLNVGEGEGNEGALVGASEAVMRVGASAATCVLLRFLNMMSYEAGVVMPRISSPELETPCAQDRRVDHLRGLSRNRLVADVCDHDPETPFSTPTLP
jgi:hypothetical protein